MLSCFALLLTEFFTLLMINCVFKSERTSAYEFASAEETRIFERQSVFSRTLSAIKAAEVLSEKGEFLWRIFVASLASYSRNRFFGICVSYLSSWFIFVLQIRKWFY